MTAVQGAKSPHRLEALTGIRGIAAWLVVLFHARHSLYAILPRGVIDCLDKGYLAVDLFFVLSGFVLWFNYGERLRDGGRAAAADFLWRRFARVWPLHAVILSLFVAMAAVLALAGKPNSSYRFSDLPLHILLVQTWGFIPRLNWNIPAWSISTEFAAYLAFPLLAAWKRWDRLPAPVLLGIASLVTGLLALMYLAAGEPTLGKEIYRFGVWRCLAQFCLGVIVCLLWQKWRERPFAAIGASCTALLLLAIGLTLSLPEVMFVPATFACGILALALARGPLARALGARPLVYLGEISYSTYLSHYLLFIVFKFAFVGEDLQIGWPALAGYLALVAVASVVLHRFVELPAQRWLNVRRPGWASTRRLAPAE